MNKIKVIKSLTKDWQSTKQISNKIKSGSQNIIATLYELLIDDKIIKRKVMPFGKVNIIYWRLK